MRAGLTISVLLHTLIALMIIYGLPDFFAPEEFEQAIPVQIVNVSDKTTQTEMPEPPTPQALEPPKPEPSKPAAPEPEQAKPEPPKPEPPKPQAAPEPTPAPEPEPVPEPVLAPPEPEATPEPEPEPEPEIEETTVEPPPPAPPKKPAPPQLAERPKEEPEPEPESDITSVLKNVENLKKQTEEEAQPTPPQAASQAPLGDELSTSEKDAINQQFMYCWHPDVGMQGLEDIVVEIVVQLNPDGSVFKAFYADPGRVSADHRYRVVAEGALRAVNECSPLRVPFSKNYQTWKQMTLSFNAREGLGL